MTSKTFPIRGGKTWTATWDDNPFNPQVVFDTSALTAGDVAYHLSYVNRFCGAAGKASVAEHSVKLAKLVLWVNPQTQPHRILQCLLHDASEALGCADAHGWLKKRLCPGIRAFEAAVVDHVFQQFVGGAYDWAWLKPFDQRLGDWEAKCYGFPHEYTGDDLPKIVSPEHWSPERSLTEFIAFWLGVSR